ncbi:hypothetical protein [Aquimarina agarivorans]|uniref:hypothetical protein n=1 Tax=Aquimarina agarivorans TaxID=980584 RepID=UPI000248F865|nr:hypothetical protein [Aquimarina agarivorans]
MGLLTRRKNKKFSYTPRYYKSEKEGSPFELSHKFDSYRSTIETPKSLKGKFSSAWDEYRSNPRSSANKRVLYICIILLLLFLFIIDFDLSIFFKR